MSTIVTRSGKGSPLTHVEVDANFTNLNTDKYQSGDAVSFTTLTATGQTSLGGAAGSEGLRVTPLASSTTYINARAGVNGGNAQFGLNGTGNTDFIQYTLGTGAFRFLTNGIGVDQFRITHTASAVNYVQVTGGSTGNSPSILGTGSDASVGLQLAGKGGTIDFRNNGVGTAVQFSVAFTSSSVNYLSATGSGVSGNAPRLYALGSDTNIPVLLQSKGTGAIDLAAGSSGVNISNGGTVTALTRTAAGTGYTSPPTVAITAPTTAGGVQATASAFLQLATTPTITSGGTGYTVNDVLTFVGGTIGLGATASAVTVTSVSGGVITGISINQFGTGYSTVPTNPISVTGGTGSGATFTVSGWQISAFTITNAGSGYVEQPTVSFSGGGGSGAAAYATVGSGTIIKSLGSTGTQALDFYTASSASNGVPSLRLRETVGDTYVMIGQQSSIANIYAQGSTNGNLTIGANGSGRIAFTTSGTSAVDQMRVSHTASAVNYVQVTGAATGNNVAISAQGSDTNIGMTFATKGSFGMQFNNASGGSIVQYTQNGTVSATANFLRLTNFNGTGGNPVLSAQGSDTNIDLTLTPKGTGNVRFGTYTASMALTIQGYIEIKDSGGTVRKLAVIA